LHWEGRGPLVTAIVRTHKEYAGFLPRALKSVLGQSIPLDHLEILIGHDGPDDDETVQVCKDTLGHVECNSRMFSTPRHHGYYCVPTNFAILAAEAPYLAFLDADNEWGRDHLKHLVTALRIPEPGKGWAHFAYTRRLYVRDEGAEGELPTGPSPLVEWDPHRLLHGPEYNYIDSSDLMIPRSVLYQLSTYSGQMWNVSVRRFGDWELVSRMAEWGLRGRAVDSVSNIYHWHGKNLQVTRSPDEGDVVVVPDEQYDKLKREGKIR